MRRSCDLDRVTAAGTGGYCQTQLSGTSLPAQRIFLIGWPWCCRTNCPPPPRAGWSSLPSPVCPYYGCQQSDSLEDNLTTLLDCPRHFQGFSLLLSQILDLLAKDDSSKLKVMKLELLLNCLKLQLFSLVGPIDPAEKQAIKQKYAVEGLDVVRDRIRVMDTFSEVLGVTHPHRDLLARRKEMLVEEVGRRKCLTAVRGEEASFVSLSKDLTHFVQTVGSSNTVLTLFSSLEMMTTSLAEAQMWVKPRPTLSSSSEAVQG